MDHFSQTWAHLILFALWLGAHVAILALLWQMRAAVGKDEESAPLLRAMMVVERLPRTAFVMMLPMGLQLAQNLKLFHLGGLGALGVWIVAVVWLVGIWIQPRSSRSDIAVGIRTAQRVLMVTVGLMMIGTAVLSLLSGEPIAARWLAGKFAIYGLALLLVFGIELVTEPLLYTLDKTSPRPSAPFDEVLGQALPRATALALVLYLGLGAASWLGLVQPA